MWQELPLGVSPNVPSWRVPPASVMRTKQTPLPTPVSSTSGPQWSLSERAAKDAAVQSVWLRIFASWR